MANSSVPMREAPSPSNITNRRPNVVGEVAEADQDGDDDDRVDGEYAGRHRGGEVPLLGIKPVGPWAGACTRPEDVGDHARRKPRSSPAAPSAMSFIRNPGPPGNIETLTDEERGEYWYCAP